MKRINLLNKNLKELKVKRLSHNRQGSYGSYYQLSNTRGVKLFSYGMYDERYYDFECLSLILKQKRLLKNIYKEAYLIKQAEKSKISPRNPKIQLFKRKDLFYIGLEMEHFNGRVLEESSILDMEELMCTLDGDFIKGSRKNNFENEICCDDYVYNKMKEIGIHSRDIHGHNIIITNDKKVKLIDFSPQGRWCYSDSLKSQKFNYNFEYFMYSLNKLVKRRI